MEPSSTETAHEDLQYIRRTLDAAGRFTAVPGWGLMCAGIAALGGVAVNLGITGPPWGGGPLRQEALQVWGIVLGISLAIVSFGIYRKSEQTGARLQAPLVRKLLWSLCPALFVGAILTGLAARTGNLGWLPAIWLGCYGAAITNGGQVSVAPVRYLGLALLGTAAGAALLPQELGLVWLAAGFGWLHLGFGAYIAWRHDG